MMQRAEDLHATARQQIDQLQAIARAQSVETLQRPCPGRMKLGDGSLGAVILHTIENYQRIGNFAAGREPQADDAPQDSKGARQSRSYGISRLLGAIGHRPPDHGDHYSASSASPERLVTLIENAREALAPISALSVDQLDAVPAAGGFRFADGKRTLEEVLLALFKHQAHQLDAIRDAVSAGRPLTASQ